MKKAFRFFVIVLVIVIVAVLADRRTHINEYGYYDGKTYVRVQPVMFTYEHKEDWLRFEDVGMDFYEANLVVEDYRALSRTWGDEVACAMLWAFKGKGGQPFALNIEQTSVDYLADLIYVPGELTSYNDTVSYYVPSMSEHDQMFMIEFKDEVRRVRITFYYVNMSYVMPALEKVYKEFQ